MGRGTGMRVVVVGGTGHIGTAVAAHLRELGHEVTCFSRGKKGPPAAGVAHLRGDRREREEFERTMRDGQFDAAVDMMCFDAEDAASSVRAFRGTKHFVHCSTVVTYGTRFERYPVREEFEGEPTSPYGRAKQAADRLLVEAHRRGDLPVTIVKPSTTYGPASGLLRQIAFDLTWIDRIRKGLPIAICGDGDALHQFMHADDCGQAIARLVGRDACMGETYNIVPNRCWTWREHHELAMEAVGGHAEIVSIPYDKLARADIPGFQICEEIFRHHSYFSADKLTRDVPDFSPRYSLVEGMRATLESGPSVSADDNSWEDELIDAFG